MRVLITQSNYVPWKGYFDAMGRADVCVLYDDAQYTKRDWRNRNKIKTPQGLKWLTIPVKVKNRYHQAVRETEVLDHGWADSHWQTIRHNYRAAPCFDETAALLSELYRRAESLSALSEINHLFLSELAAWMSIDVSLRWSSEFDLLDGKTERLLGICQDLGATSYLSGPAARAYLDVELFADAGIEVEWMDYAGYQPYPQIHGGFEHGVSIIDALVHLGADSHRCLTRAPVADTAEAALDAEAAS